MKRTIVTLVVMLIAPLAFAQTSSTHKRQATTTEPITVTGTIIPTPEEGAAAAYQPANTLVVREDKSNYPLGAMFSTDLVTLWTNQEESSKPRSNLALACLFIT